MWIAACHLEQPVVLYFLFLDGDIRPRPSRNSIYYTEHDPFASALWFFCLKYIAMLFGTMHFFNLFTYAGLLVVSHASSIAFIPPQHTYLLTSSFSTNISESWTVSTTTTNFSLNSVVNGAQNASFIVYDQEFSSIIGDQPNLTLVEQRADQFAAEGGVWAFDRNEVWFSSGVVGEDATSIYVLNLSNNTITHPTFTGDPIPNANGGYYYNRTVYFTTAGNANQVASVVSINPATKVATTIVNLYFDFASISLMMWRGCIEAGTATCSSRI